MNIYAKILAALEQIPSWAIIRRGVWILFSLILLPGILFAGDGPGIILLNSDGSVDKYNLAREGFLESIGYPVQEIDLNDPKWTPALVEATLRDEKTSLIYCIGAKAYLLANHCAGGKNIVFSSAIDWLRLPMGKHTFGISDELHSGMELTLFRLIFPDVKRIGVLYSTQYTRQWFSETRDAAAKMGVEIVGRSVADSRQAVAALKGLIEEVEVLWLISDPAILSDQKDLFRLMEECRAKKKPVFSFHEAFARYGVVLIASVDDSTVGRQAAATASRILSGREIKEKVQFPAGSQVVLNLRRAGEYGLRHREGALGAVSQIVEY